MTKLRQFETPADNYGFVGTHVLDGGPLLSHIRLAVLDERGHMGNIQNLGVQIGRCDDRRGGRGCGRAWAWKRGAAGLDEMRCPGCGHHLSQTTLALQRAFFIIEPFAVRVIATDTLAKARTRAYERLAAYEGDTEHTDEWRQFNIRQTEKEIERLNGRLKKVQRNPRRQKAVA
jgi:hypothetical protein